MKKILIAFASRFNAENFKEKFVQEGFQVATTENGEEALQIIRKDPPDIVLADASLPEINGFRIIESLREKEETKRIPVIIYSSTGREEDREEAMSYEAKDFISGHTDSPHTALTKVKSHLGEQKSYTLEILSSMEGARELVEDLGYDKGMTCSTCRGKLSLHFIRNLSMGRNLFHVSVICTHCSFRRRMEEK